MSICPAGIKLLQGVLISETTHLKQPATWVIMALVAWTMRQRFEFDFRLNSLSYFSSLRQIQYANYQCLDPSTVGNNVANNSIVSGDNYAIVFSISGEIHKYIPI